MPVLAISIDIGSTWTKGILLDADEGRILGRRSIATSQNDLSLGFSAIYESLIKEASATGSARVSVEPEVFLSSSAKGGLRIAAIGLVPELTLKAARLAAASAGGKVVASYAYRLKERDLRSLGEAMPDLVLLAGGTNGGDEGYALHNARMLADSSLQAAIVFAGNEAAQDEVIRLLRSAGKRAVATHNILPDLESLEIEGARKAIAELFLERIVEGKGLSKVRSLCSAEPQATPASVFNLVEALYERTWGTELDLYELRRGFLCLDLGGATTDVYSASQAYAGDAQISCRGIPEGTIQRTVEGDLGLRISAEHTLEQGLHLRSKNSSPLKREALASYVMRIGTDPSYLPRNSEEEDLDAFLAETCIAESLQRHAGSLEAVYTASGLRWIQRGKDLRGIKVLIGTGGRLAQEGSASLISSALGTEWRGTKEGRLEERAKQILIPSLEGLRYYRDSQYILPLVANLVGKHSEIACKIALSSLIEEPIGKEPIGDAP